MSCYRAAFAWAYEASGRRPKGLPLRNRLADVFSLGWRGGAAAAAPMAGAVEDGGSGTGGETQRGDVFDAQDLKALQALSGALRKAGVTIDDP